METTVQIKRNGYLYKYPIKLEITPERIKFLKSPFSLKDEIKAMRGPKWHGFDKENPQMIWSVENCPRNVFQLRHLMGENVYEHFDQDPMPVEDIPDFPFRDKVMPQQLDMIRQALTYHFHILAAEQGLGKSLAAISIATIVGGRWLYVGPKPAGVSFELELEKWGVPEGLFEKIVTYEGAEKMTRYEPDWFKGLTGVVFDESSYIKNDKANRSIAAQFIADTVREETNNSGYVIELSGTPTAKSPGDIWSQAEIAWPGFMREGSLHAFKRRYAIIEEGTNLEGQKFLKEAGWHEEEVAKIPDRLRGLMTTYRKKDWLNLPEKKFRRVRLEPSKKVLRVAKALVNVAPQAATALTWLRALSSGFQYVMQEDGTQACRACNMITDPSHDCPVCDNTRVTSSKKQITRTVKTPKEDALREEIQGLNRVIVPASFKGSIDRCQKIAHEEGFAVCRVDGRGWFSYDNEGNLIKNLHPMRHWKEWDGPVAFIGNPGSCKYGLTLIEAKKMIFFDNDFSAENRLQMIDRLHRIGQDEEVEIVDLVHLPVDEKVLETLDNNRSLELISLGSLSELLGDEEPENVTLD